MTRKKTLRKRLRKFIRNGNNHRNGRIWCLKRITNLKRIEESKESIKAGKYAENFLKGTKEIGRMMTEILEEMEDDWPSKAFIKDCERKVKRNRYATEEKHVGYFEMVRQFNRNLAKFKGNQENSPWNEVIYRNETVPNLIRLEFLQREILREVIETAIKLNNGERTRKHLPMEEPLEKPEV